MTENKDLCLQFLEISIITCTPKVGVHSGMWHQCECSSGSAAPQPRCGSSGIEAGGVEDGNPGLAVAELLNYSCPPTLLASFPLCTASTETSITVWMKSLCLSPSLNLKCGVLFFFFFAAICVKAVARHSCHDNTEYCRCWNWTEFAPKTVTQRSDFLVFCTILCVHFKSSHTPQRKKTECLYCFSLFWTLTETLMCSSLFGV